MPIQDETIQKFQDLFACTKGFQAVPLTNTPDENGKIKYEKHISTAGRFILSSILPKNHKIKFSLIDRILSKKNVSEVIDLVIVVILDTPPGPR